MANKFNKDQIADDAVNDTHIDWGTGANQVSAVDVPILDAGGFYASEDVEGALQEIAGGGGGGNGKVLISVDDTTSDYLGNKLTAGTGITLTENDDGGDETLAIAVPNDHASGSDNQNLFATVAGDSGSTTADSETDTLTVAGGDGLETAIVDDTLTINISADGVKDYHVDWGTGANQVNLDDIPDGTTSKLGQDCSTTGNPTFASVSGGNVTSGADPGHTHSAYLTAETDPVYSANTYATGMNQGVATTDSPSFVNATLSGKTAGSILFAGAGGAITQDNANFFYDDTNDRIGKGTASPDSGVHILGSTLEKVRLHQEITDNLSVAHNLRRNQSGGSYNISWFNYIPASSTDLRWQTASTDFMTLTADGKLGLGINPVAASAQKLNLYYSGATPAGTGMMTSEVDAYWNEVFFTTYSSGDPLHANSFGCSRSRGSKASKSAVTSGDNIGYFNFRGHDGTDFQQRASFGATVDGAVSAGNVPLALRFLTGTTSNLERARISSAGKFGINTTTPQAKFHAVDTAETNVHYDQYATAIIESTEGRLQVIADDAGNDAAVIMLTNAPAAGNNNHWGIAQRGATRNNRFEIGYVSSAASGGNIITGDFADFSITTAGNVGIGMTAVEKLDVNGTIKGTGYKSSDGSAGVSGTVAGSTFKDGLLTTAVSGVKLTVSTADVSSPPTDAELDSAFGTPATVGAGFIGIVNDNNTGTAEYLCWSDGTNWFYAAGTKAT